MQAPPLNLLVIECTPHLSWFEAFAGAQVQLRLFSSASAST
jgi:hypothetical protein